MLSKKERKFGFSKSWLDASKVTIEGATEVDVINIDNESGYADLSRFKEVMAHITASSLAYTKRMQAMMTNWSRVRESIKAGSKGSESSFLEGEDARLNTHLLVMQDWLKQCISDKKVALPLVKLFFLNYFFRLTNKIPVTPEGATFMEVLRNNAAGNADFESACASIEKLSEEQRRLESIVMDKDTDPAALYKLVVSRFKLDDMEKLDEAYGTVIKDEYLIGPDGVSSFIIQSLGRANMFVRSYVNALAEDKVYSLYTCESFSSVFDPAILIDDSYDIKGKNLRTVLKEWSLLYFRTEKASELFSELDTLSRNLLQEPASTSPMGYHAIDVERLFQLGCGMVEAFTKICEYRMNVLKCFPLFVEYLSNDLEIANAYNEVRPADRSQPTLSSMFDEVYYKISEVPMFLPSTMFPTKDIRINRTNFKKMAGARKEFDSNMNDGWKYKDLVEGLFRFMQSYIPSANLLRYQLLPVYINNNGNAELNSVILSSLEKDSGDMMSFKLYKTHDKRESGGTKSIVEQFIRGGVDSVEFYCTEPLSLPKELKDCRVLSESEKYILFDKSGIIDCKLPSSNIVVRTKGCKKDWASERASIVLDFIKDVKSHFTSGVTTITVDVDDYDGLTTPRQGYTLHHKLSTTVYKFVVPSLGNIADKIKGFKFPSWTGIERSEYADGISYTKCDIASLTDINDVLRLILSPIKTEGDMYQLNMSQGLDEKQYDDLLNIWCSYITVGNFLNSKTFTPVTVTNYPKLSIEREVGSDTSAKFIIGPSKVSREIRKIPSIVKDGSTYYDAVNRNKVVLYDKTKILKDKMSESDYMRVKLGWVSTMAWADRNNLHYRHAVENYLSPVDWTSLNDDFINMLKDQGLMFNLAGLSEIKGSDELREYLVYLGSYDTYDIWQVFIPLDWRTIRLGSRGDFSKIYDSDSTLSKLYMDFRLTSDTLTSPTNFVLPVPRQIKETAALINSYYGWDEKDCITLLMKECMWRESAIPYNLRDSEFVSKLVIDFILNCIEIIKRQYSKAYSSRRLRALAMIKYSIIEVISQNCPTMAIQVPFVKTNSYLANVIKDLRWKDSSGDKCAFSKSSINYRKLKEWIDSTVDFSWDPLKLRGVYDAASTSLLDFINGLAPDKLILNFKIDAPDVFYNFVPNLAEEFGFSDVSSEFKSELVEELRTVMMYYASEFNNDGRVSDHINLIDDGDRGLNKTYRGIKTVFADCPAVAHRNASLGDYAAKAQTSIDEVGLALYDRAVAFDLSKQKWFFTMNEGSSSEYHTIIQRQDDNSFVVMDAIENSLSKDVTLKHFDKSKALKVTTTAMSDNPFPRIIKTICIASNREKFIGSTTLESDDMERKISGLMVTDKTDGSKATDIIITKNHMYITEFDVIKGLLLSFKKTGKIFLDQTISFDDFASAYKATFKKEPDCKNFDVAFNHSVVLLLDATDEFKDALKVEDEGEAIVMDNGTLKDEAFLNAAKFVVLYTNDNPVQQTITVVYDKALYLKSIEKVRKAHAKELEKKEENAPTENDTPNVEAVPSDNVESTNGEGVDNNES